jgi:signal peptidase I
MNDSGHQNMADADPGASAQENAQESAQQKQGNEPAVQPDLDPAAEQGTAEPTAQADQAESAPRAASRATRRPRARRRRSFWLELPILIAVALVLAVAIKSYALQAFFIPSGSMENTLEINDRVLVNKLVYDFRSIHRGDIVVFNGDGSWDSGPEPVSQNFVAEFVSNFGSMFGFGQPGEIYVKRVIGLPGDHVACCNAQGQITVNGVALSESSYLYPGDAPSTMRFNIVVPPGRLWVMGDNRSVSDDSRGHMGDPGGGTIPETAVLGRAFVIIWPLDRWRFLPIPATFEQAAFSKVAAGPGLPLTLGFAGAVPLTLAQRKVRNRRGRENR